MTIRVECYSGYKADQRPLRFWLDDREYAVTGILDQWYGPGYTYFRLRASDGHVYILRHATSGDEDVWTLTAYSA
jgi:hypothetical protein